MKPLQWYKCGVACNKVFVLCKVLFGAVHICIMKWCRKLLSRFFKSIDDIVNNHFILQQLRLALAILLLWCWRMLHM